MYWYQKQSKTKRGESFVKCNFGVPVVVLKVEKVIFATNFKPLNAVMWESYDTTLVFAFANPLLFIMIPLWNFKQSSDWRRESFAACRIHQADYFTARSWVEHSNPAPSLPYPPTPTTAAAQPPSSPLRQEVYRSGLTHRLTWCRDCDMDVCQLLQGFWKLLFKGSQVS